MNYIPKFNHKPIFWTHHYLGWKLCSDAIDKNLHTSTGTLLFSHFETEIMKNNIITSPWVGFIHNTIKGHNNGLNIDNILKSRTWNESFMYCKGIFVLSEYIKNYLEIKINPKVETLIHPTVDINEQLKFNMKKFHQNQNKKVVMIGQWLRKFNSINKLKTIYRKAVLFGCHINYSKYRFDANVIKLPKINNNDYDLLLSKNLVFLDLEDSSANNVIIECIVRNNPIIVNRLPATEEYLGKNYPLLFDTLDEAEEKINDINLIEKSYNYMINHPLKSKLDINYFINSICNSKIYDCLPPKKLKFI